MCDFDYFIIYIAFDGGLNTDGSNKNGLFITPPSDVELWTAPTSVEDQMSDWRSSLINYGDTTNDWEATKGTGWAGNTQEYELQITSDIENGETDLTVSKNGNQATHTFGSTWDSGEDYY